MTQPHYIDRELADRLEKAADAQPLLLTLPPQESAIAKLLREAAEALSRPAPMEAVAWREKVARLAWPAAFAAKDQESAAARRAVAEAFERADAILQALAVIPTEGGEG